MRVVTWNVNSVKARLERVTSWLTRHAPDVLLLQELKTQEESFPFDALAKLGYQAAVQGQRTYNGVAVVAKHPIEDVRRGLADGVEDPQARLVSARVRGVRFISVYVPNGSEVGSEKWGYKLAWLARLAAYLRRHHAPSEPLVLGGDFNVAPEDRDVHEPDVWRDSVLCHPDARRALEQVTAFGLADAYRLHHSEGGAYSWWDYRMLAFPKNNGLRIDQLWLTTPLVAKCTSASMDRDERKGKQPSDHVPVMAELAVD